MAVLKNRLQEMGVVRSEDKIISDYAEWFCSFKLGIELCNESKLGYDALSKFGERIQIKSRIGSDIDFKIAFDGIRVNEFDYLLVTFINMTTWMIDSIYKVSHEVVKRFLSNDKDKRFKWTRESRSLSLQLYPGDDNMIVM